MATYRIPDHIVCLGGGGTNLGQTFISQDWVLEEFVRQNPRDSAPDNNNDQLKTFFVDTDNSSLPSEGWITSQIDDPISSMKEKYDVVDPNIDVETINIGEGTHEKYLRPAQVTSPSRIQTLADDQGIKAWWIDDDPDNRIIGPLDGLKRGGVDRMRALTKAITRMSEHGSDPLDTIIQSITNTNDPEVAVVVGLGGGTGSGILIDLVKRIGEAGANITLFGILPNPSGDDGADVLANAYATLSELEYLALTDAGLFRNRILLPYDPAVSDDNFDKAACYTISSYYNISEDQSNTYKDFNENTDNGPPAFAPFTIGSTRYLHYLKEDYDQIEEKFQKFFDIKRDHVDIESDLYDEIESFIESNYDSESDYLRSTAASPEGTKLSNEKALDLRDRLNRIEDLLNEPFMKEIGFFSPAKLSKTVSDVKDDSEEQASWDNERDKAAAVARDLIPRLADAVNPNNVTEFEPADEGWNSGEREFIKKVIEEFELIARRAGIVQAVKAIEDTGGDKNETIAVDLRSAISPDDSGHAAGAEKIKDEFENEITELNNEKLALDTVIQNAESAIDSEYADQDGLIVQYEDAVGDTISEYYALAEKKNTIDNLLGELRDEIENKTGRVIQKQTPENIIIEGTDFEKYDTLNSILREFDIDEVNSESIESSVKSVQRARKKQLEAQQKQDSVGESIRSLLGKGTIGGLRSDYDGIKDREIHQDIISISDWSDGFDVVVHAKYFDERREQISNEKDEIVGTINNVTENILQTAEELQERPTNWIPDHETQAQKIAEQIGESSTSYDRTFITDYLDNNSVVDNNKNSDELLKGPIKQELQEALHEILIEPYETKRSDVQDQVKRIKDKKSKFENLEEIVKNPGQDYYSVTDDLIGVDEIAESEEIDESGNFKIKAKPYSRGELGGSDDLGDTKLWSKDREKRELLSILEDVVPNLSDDYLPISQRYIEEGNSSEVDYDYHKVYSVFSSTIFDEYDDSSSAEIDTLSKHFTNFKPLKTTASGDPEYHATRTTFADSYDFALTSFLSGVFLDNLEIFSDVCRDVYESSNEIEKTEGKYHHQDSVPETVRHHTYGIDGLLYHDGYQFLPEESDGGYCYRDTVMNFDTDGAEQLLDNGGDNTTFGEDVREMILEEFYSFVGYPSTIDLE